MACKQTCKPPRLNVEATFLVVAKWKVIGSKNCLQSYGSEALRAERRVTSFWYKSNLCETAAWHVANKTSHAWAIKLNLCYLFKARPNWLVSVAGIYTCWKWRRKSSKVVGPCRRIWNFSFPNYLASMELLHLHSFSFGITDYLWRGCVFFLLNMYQPLIVTGVPQLAF